jgi:hypothetical protein
MPRKLTPSYIILQHQRDSGTQLLLDLKIKCLLTAHMYVLAAVRK